MRIMPVAYNNQQNNSQPAFSAKPMPVDVANKMKAKLLDSAVKHIDVYCHASPDEDTVNSMKVIANWLKKLGKSFSVCVNTKGASNLYFNPKDYPVRTDDALADLALLLDFNGEERVPAKYLENFRRTQNVIGFDHHGKADTFIERGDIYTDTSAKSNCGIIYRFFESIGELDRLSLDDCKSLYCGMLSDLGKSKLVEVREKQLYKLDRYYEDGNENSREIFEKIEAKLGESDKTEIYKHLDILSNLTREELDFQKRLFSDIQITPNGRLAYVIIKPDDEQWINLGRDNTRTSTIINDFRKRIMGADLPPYLSTQEKEKLRGVKGAMVFYTISKNGPYQMSIHSKDGYAERLRMYIKGHINPDLQAGGHSNRQGGKAASMEQRDIDAFINSFLTAAEKVD